MFAVDNVLLSDEVLDAPFACDLARCKGGCCVEGDSGAPLEPEERERLDAALPVVWDDLLPAARRVIEERGTWEETSPGDYATTCVDDRECVFVVYEKGVAKCAIDRAYRKGKTDWPKPISCHLYPIRVSHYGDLDVLNYERIPLCDPGCALGFRSDVQLIDFLRDPLTRKYGADWYDQLRETWLERRAVLNVATR